MGNALPARNRTRRRTACGIALRPMYFVFPADFLHDHAHGFAASADQFCKRLDSMHVNPFRLPRKLFESFPRLASRRGGPRRQRRCQPVPQLAEQLVLLRAERPAALAVGVHPGEQPRPGVRVQLDAVVALPQQGCSADSAAPRRPRRSNGLGDNVPKRGSVGSAGHSRPRRRKPARLPDPEPTRPHPADDIGRSAVPAPARPGHRNAAATSRPAPARSARAHAPLLSGGRFGGAVFRGS